VIAGVEMMMDAMKHPVGVLLAPGMAKEDVPVGTEAWSPE
jgi:hypothetical protein